MIWWILFLPRQLKCKITEFFNYKGSQRVDSDFFTIYCREWPFLTLLTDFDKKETDETVFASSVLNCLAFIS